MDQLSLVAHGAGVAGDARCIPPHVAHGLQLPDVILLRGRARSDPKDDRSAFHREGCSAGHSCVGVKVDMQLVLIWCEVMCEEMAAEIPRVAHDVLQDDRLQTSGTGGNGDSPPAWLYPVAHKELGSGHGVPVSSTRGHCQRR